MNTKIAIRLAACGRRRPRRAKPFVEPRLGCGSGFARSAFGLLGAATDAMFRPLVVGFGRNSLFRFWSAIVGLICLQNHLAVAQEMTFVLSGNGGNCNGCEWVAAQGEITPRTVSAYAEYTATNGDPYLIVFNSPGGDLAAGIELGRMIRASGATTSIGKTQSMADDLASYEETSPGVCASACAFAFMGGVERWVDDESLLGVHQFYSVTEEDIRSEVVQRIVGLTLLHAVDMGIDPAVIVAASGTSPENMYWFQEAELAEFNLTTNRSSTSPWRLEPYKAGLVLTTIYKESVRRSVNLTIFCRRESNAHFLLISEHAPFYADQLAGDDLLRFAGQYRNQPTLQVGPTRYRIEERNLEFQRISDGTFYVSVQLPSDVSQAGGQVISFEPDLAQVYNTLVSATVLLPSNDWLQMTSKNCI